jgi:DNA-directed RNA polymerase specialized sigma subunit
MTFSAKQLEGDESIELRLKDKSRKDDITPVSTDEAIYEIASAKEDITNSIMRSVKEASIDCALHVKSNASEKLQCFSFGSNNSSKLAYNLSYEDEQSDAIANQNQKEIEWKAKVFTDLDGTKYALNPATQEVYDLEIYKAKNLEKIGTLVQLKTGEWTIDKTFKM